MGLRLPDFETLAHEGAKIASPTLQPALPLPSENIPGTHFC